MIGTAKDQLVIISSLLGSPIRDAKRFDGVNAGVAAATPFGR